MEDFILKIPKWEGEIRFTYDAITFVLVWLMLLAGLLLCFWGYKYVQTLCLFVLGCLCGNIGIEIVENMIQNIVLKMYIFVMFLFISVCFLYLLSIMLGTVLRKFRIGDELIKKRYLLTAVCGGIVTGEVVYLRIYHNIWVAAVLFLGLAIMGSLYGKKKIAEQKPFLTYEDLYRMQSLKAGDTNA